MALHEKLAAPGMNVQRPCFIFVHVICCLARVRACLCACLFVCLQLHDIQMSVGSYRTICKHAALLAEKHHADMHHVYIMSGLPCA